MTKIKLTRGQQTVLKALAEYRTPLDDVGLAVYVHHVADKPMSSSGVRTRRVELERKGLVALAGARSTRSGRMASTHAITAAGRLALRRATA